MSGDPVRTTRATYDEVAAHFLERTRDRSHGQADLDAFVAALPGGARVLDVGSGPGCDAAELRPRGLRPICVDLSMGMLRAGALEMPGPRVQADLRRLPFADHCVRGVWANACLLHLSPGALRLALDEITRVCAPGARVHVSVKTGEGAAWETERYDRPRWFQYWSPDAFDTELRNAGWSILDAREEQSRRDGWVVRMASPGETTRQRPPEPSLRAR